MKLLREELFAYISGDIHEGVNDEYLRPMFRDFEAVKQAWEELVRERTNPSEARYSLKDQSPEARAANWRSSTNICARSSGFPRESPPIRRPWRTLAKSPGQRILHRLRKRRAGGAAPGKYDWMGNGKDKSGNELTYEGLREKALAVSRDILSAL